MGSTEVPLRDYQCLKMPTANYEFGVNFMDPKLMMLGRLLMDGRLNARIKWDLSNDPSFNANALLTKEPNMSHGMFRFDYKGHDYRTQFHFGNGSLFGGNCIQVSLATEFMYNYLSTEAVATVGYDHILGHAFVSRLIRGKIDTNGCNSAVLEERLNMGLKFVLSAEIDHEKKDYRFGFGLTVGQGKRIEKLFRHLLSHFVA